MYRPHPQASSLNYLCTKVVGITNESLSMVQGVMGLIAKSIWYP